MQQELGLALPGRSGALAVLEEFGVVARRDMAATETLAVGLDDQDLDVVLTLVEGLIETLNHFGVLQVGL